jgi:magnesium transporter
VTVATSRAAHRRRVADHAPEVLIETLRDLLEGGPREELGAFLTRFHPSDLADLLEELEEDERREVLLALAQAPALAAEALAEMEWEEHPEDALASLEPHQIASLVRHLDDDDAADMIGELEPDDRDRVLAALPSLDAGDIRDLLRYDEESAGGLMTTELVAVDERMTAAEAIEAVRRQGQDIGEFYNVFVINGDRQLTGLLPLHLLVTASPGVHVSDLTQPVIATVMPEMDQEDVAHILSRYNLVAVPVVDEDNRLLGRITFDDVIDVFEAETTEDILKFGGVSQEEEIRGGSLDAVRSRLPWLGVNLLTAFGAASVVVVFESTIDSLPILAAWMPVIAGMGGNAGTQALAVTVRRLALSPESAGRRWEVIGKELVVGIVNGLAIGAAVATVALLLDRSAMLGVVVMAAMWMNLIVAGFAGAFVPIVLERAGIDPAVASSIFVTTFTDLVGFFLLLGLATNLLL